MSNSNGFDLVKPAVFIDRDGTINVEKEYLYRVEDFEFIPGAADAIRRLNLAGFLVIVVTNQSGIARGFYSQDDLQRLHSHVEELLAKEGARVDAWYFCPHHPDGIPPHNILCDCRKPLPGMLLKAASEHRINLADSWMVGDKLVDAEAGLAAGCHPVMVQTGYGASEKGGIAAGVELCDDLEAAVGLILAKTAVGRG